MRLGHPRINNLGIRGSKWSPKVRLCAENSAYYSEIAPVFT